jgi:RNA-directed DNA polymerase
MTRERTYRDIDWNICQQTVFQLQQKIAVAWTLGDKTSVKRLQNQLTISFAGRALAVRRVSSAPGKKTPGVDGLVWTTDKAKYEAIMQLAQLANYQAQPVRRVNIPKPNGGTRPLGIPCMFDRAVQTLYNLALVPIAESTADAKS